MSTKENIYNQLTLIDLTDEDLLQLVGALWESIKRIDEAMKEDREIERQQEALKQYKEERYLGAKKEHARRLKAARALAKARGLAINLPEGSERS